MAEHRKPLVLATAAFTQLSGLTSAYQAAIMRGDDAEVIRIRAEAHDLLDSCFDLNAEAAVAVLAIINR